MKSFATLFVVLFLTCAFAEEAKAQVRMHDGAMHFFMNAQALYEKGEIAQALGACEDALILAEDLDGSVNLLVGMCHLKREEQDMALEAFKKAVEYNADLLEAHHYLARIYKLRNEEDKVAEQELIIARLERMR